MKNLLCICAVIFICFVTQALASEINVPGETAHVLGGAAIAGVATAIADKYWPEHRALIGFSFSTACGIIGEGIDRAQYGEKFSSMLQDVAFHTIGAAIGAVITDRYILMPVIKRDHANSTYFGLAIQHSF
jgi:uncharacterized protein YfiM (DUF2279 family)